jgi:hypothetical protein
MGIASCAASSGRALRPAAAPLWRAGASYGYSWSDLAFTDGVEPAIGRRAAVVTVERRMTPAFTLQLGAGASLWGELVMDDREAPGGRARYLLSPGWLASISASIRLVDGAGARPFVLLSGTLSASGASTARELAGAPSGSFYAFDIRAGATIGKTLWQVVSPYAAVRAFGGPIFWHTGGETRLGTDRYHFQIAAGAAVNLHASVDVFAEIVPLGERAVTLGAGVSF